MQVMAGRGILRYELPLAKIIMLVFTGEVRANELRLNWLTHAPWVKTARIGLRGAWCELCAYLNLTGRAWHVARLNYLRLVTAGGYYVKPKNYLNYVTKNLQRIGRRDAQRKNHTDRKSCCSFYRLLCFCIFFVCFYVGVLLRWNPNVKRTRCGEYKQVLGRKRPEV